MTLRIVLVAVSMNNNLTFIVQENTVYDVLCGWNVLDHPVCCKV